MDKSNMKEKYGQLYDAMTSKETNPNKRQMYKEMFTVPIFRPLLCTFTAIEGKNYNSGKFPKFMLVGRAVNGWDEKRDYPAEIDRELFVQDSYQNFISDSSVAAETIYVDENGSKRADRFEWIGDSEGGAPNNAYRQGIDPLKSLIVGAPYSLSRPLWNYSKKIWCDLFGEDTETAWKERWYDNIVWTNLYKVAPTYGWNPDESLKALQQEECQAILEEEIRIFKPDYILFMTGYDGWFSNFKSEFFSLPRVDMKYVKAAGNINVDGHSISAVVIDRPEQKAIKEYTEEAVTMLNKFKPFVK